MSSRRTLPLLLAVAGLIAVAALAAHGRPLSSSRGSGPTAHFFDYVFTSFAIVAIAVAVVFLYGVLSQKWAPPPADRPRFNLLQFIGSFAAAILFGWLLVHTHFRFFAPKTQNKSPKVTDALTRHARQQPSAAGRRGARLRWDEVAIVAALLGAVGVAAFAGRRRAKPMRAWRTRSHEDVALALDESLDDLRSDPDIRRAIIAAYARMERALAAAGIPRRLSEAPFEYVSRALQSLDAGGPAVTRLTDLFEHAKFSHHEPDESMREEAIAALVAVRDELRAPVEVAA
ncbi:MAG TPA: DUF4129 domain-containing protein [Gaiellaceae bacterium]